MKKGKDDDDLLRDLVPDAMLHGCMEAVVMFVVLLLLLLLFGGCKGVRYVSVPDVRTDTVLITKQQRDSIWLHDSVYLHEYQKGDTVFLLRDRWHTKYVERVRTDTLREHRVDSIGVPVPVEVKVPRELSWWQKLRLNAGGWAIGLLVVWLVWQGWKMYKRRF